MTFMSQFFLLNQKLNDQCSWTPEWMTESVLCSENIQCSKSNSYHNESYELVLLSKSEWLKKICIVSPQKRNKMSSLHWHYMGVISASLKALFFFLNLFPGWTKSSSVMPTLSASGRNTGHNASRKNKALCNTKHNTLWCSRLLWVEVGWWFLKVWLTRVCSDLQAGIREKAHTGNKLCLP